MVQMKSLRDDELIGEPKIITVISKSFFNYLWVLATIYLVSHFSWVFDDTISWAYANWWALPGGYIAFFAVQSIQEGWLRAQRLEIERKRSEPARPRERLSRMSREEKSPRKPKQADGGDV